MSGEIIGKYKLYLSVVYSSNLKDLINRGILPVGVIEESYVDLDKETSRLMEELYFKSSIYDMRYLPTILSLDLSAIEELACSGDFELSHLVDENDNVERIEKTMPTVSTEYPLRIRTVKRIGLFSKERTIKELHPLIKGAIIDKIINLRMVTPLVTAQVEEIHSNGLLTPAEKVKEWESMNICAPGDHSGKASSRCKTFHDDCHTCLVNYAYEHYAHERFSSNIKIVNSGLNEKQLKRDTHLEQNKGGS